MSPQISHFWVKYSNSVLKCEIFIIMPLVSELQIKVLVNDLALLLDLLGNSKGTKLLIYTIIFLSGVYCAREMEGRTPG